MNMKKQNMQKNVVVFVEGDTDREFFEKLLKYYRDNSTQTINTCKVYNLKGFGRYESKIFSKVKNEIKPRIEKKRKGNKIYQKGNSCHTFIDNLDIAFIREQVKNELREFEKLLGVSISK